MRRGVYIEAGGGANKPAGASVGGFNFPLWTGRSFDTLRHVMYELWAKLGARCRQNNNAKKALRETR